MPEFGDGGWWYWGGERARRACRHVASHVVHADAVMLCMRAH
jgi:hypothetical protein